MDQRPRGISLRISAGRRLVLEFMRQSRNVPLVGIRREFRIPAVAAVRKDANDGISWVALFAKAFALAARRTVQLRRNWTTFPWARIYEHPVSECVVLIEREWQGEEVVLGAKIRAPEEMPLFDIDRYVRGYRSRQVWSVSSFRQLLRVAGYPALLRRFVFWSTLNWSGRRRCKRFGTFIVSSLGNFGCETTFPRMPLTAYLYYGPVDADGRVTVGLTFDHRVMDGRHAAQALEDMERIMNTVLVAELRKSVVSETAEPSPEYAEA